MSGVWSVCSLTELRFLILFKVPGFKFGFFLKLQFPPESNETPTNNLKKLLFPGFWATILLPPIRFF